jgi:glycosyltransferase involved in cell wall biosynthesis
MISPPLVSVTLAVYNAAHVVAETIESVLAQTYPHVELIVVDDGSTDGSRKVIERYADRLVFVPKQMNERLAAGRNDGFRRAKGDLVAWIDHDDVWLPEKLALQVAFMERHPDCVVLATEFSAFDDQGFFERTHAAQYYRTIAELGLDGIFDERIAFDTRDVPYLPAGVPPSIDVYVGRIYEKLIDGNCLHPPTAMMRRSAVLAAGFCEQRFGNDVDYEYLLRVAKQGRAAFMNHPLIRYRYSEGQLSSDRNMRAIALSRLTVLEEVAKREPHRANDPSFRRRVASAHLFAAHVRAETERLPALRHLARSLTTAGIVDASQTARAFAKLALPRFLLERLRVRKGKRR